MRFVRLYRTDLQSRLRLDYDPDRDLRVLVDEDVLKEELYNPDARHNAGHSVTIELDDEIVDWLHAVTGELIAERGR